MLATMSAPLVGIIQRAGVSQPERPQGIVEDVVMAILMVHYDELRDSLARSFDTVLSATEWRQSHTVAGYFAKAQPQLAQAMLTAMTQSTAGPEMQAKTGAIKKHGGRARSHHA